MNRNWISSDAVGVFIIGMAALMRGISYMPFMVNPERSPAHLLEHIAPPTMWAWPWLISGVLCLAAIIYPRLTPPAVGAGIGLHFLWSVSFLAMGGRGWVTSIGYGAVTALALWAFSRGRLQYSAEVPVLKGD